MNELALFFRVILGVLFLSAAWSKFPKMQEHIAIVRDYRILPNAWSGWFGRAEVWLEAILGVMFLTGVASFAAALAGSSMLLMYSVAILINLLRGRTEISCGCGGVAGTHQLSWWLVLRNVVLMLAGGWLLANEGTLGSMQAWWSGVSFGEVFGWRCWVIVAMAVGLLLFYAQVAELRSVERRMVSLVTKRSGGA